MRYRKEPLWKVLNLPDRPEKYKIIINQYWALDRQNNVFFTEKYPICGASRQTTEFFIRNMKLPLRPFYKGNNAPNWPMIYLTNAWIKK